MVMLIPNCIVLLIVLWRKKAVDTCLYIHAVAASTWTHVSRVEKIAYPTP